MSFSDYSYTKNYENLILSTYCDFLIRKNPLFVGVTVEDQYNFIAFICISN